jgi:hypothetical protein
MKKFLTQRKKFSPPPPPANNFWGEKNLSKRLFKKKTNTAKNFCPLCRLPVLVTFCGKGPFIFYQEGGLVVFAGGPPEKIVM